MGDCANFRGPLFDSFDAEEERSRSDEGDKTRGDETAGAAEAAHPEGSEPLPPVSGEPDAMGSSDGKDVRPEPSVSLDQDLDSGDGGQRLDEEATEEAAPRKDADMDQSDSAADDEDRAAPGTDTEAEDLANAPGDDEDAWEAVSQEVADAAARAPSTVDVPAGPYESAEEALPPAPRDLEVLSQDSLSSVQVGRGNKGDSASSVEHWSRMYHRTRQPNIIEGQTESDAAASSGLVLDAYGSPEEAPGSDEARLAPEEEEGSALAELKGDWSSIVAIVFALVVLAAIIIAIQVVRGMYAGREEAAPVSGPEQTYIPVAADEEGASDDAEATAEDGKDSAPAIGAGIYSNLGSLVNDGLVAFGDETHVYYALPQNGTSWLSDRIVCADRKGNDQKTAYVGPDGTKNLYHITVADDYLVFVQTTQEGSSVVAAPLDGSEPIYLDTADEWSLCQVDNGWVYYVKYGTLCRSNILGEEKSELAYVGGSTYWRVWGDKLFFYYGGGSRTIYQENLDGTNQVVAYVCPDSFSIKSAYPVSEGRLLVLMSDWSGENASIVSVDLEAEDESEDEAGAGSAGEEASEGDEAEGDEAEEYEPIRTLISEAGIERIVNDEEGVYYIAKVGDGLYRIGYVDFEGRAVGSEKEIDEGGEVRFTSVLPAINTLYFGVIDEDQRCAIRTMDGIHGPVASLGDPLTVVEGRDESHPNDSDS